MTNRVRRMLLAVLVIGMIGTGSELVLTAHTEDFWQKVPVVLLALGVPAVALFAVHPSRAAATGLRALMVLFIAAGLLGTFFHFESNAEFAKELSPGLSGFALFADTMTRTTPPPLAPGTMIMLGLLGFIATIRGD
jgi:hypothetical protein